MALSDYFIFCFQESSTRNSMVPVSNRLGLPPRLWVGEARPSWSP